MKRIALVTLQQPAGDRKVARPAGLPPRLSPIILEGMSTLAEIEAAVVTLSPAEIKQLEDFLREYRSQAEEARLQDLYRITGFHPLPRRNNEVITNEFINQLREEENI